jgi:hypothetical protein
MLGACGPRAGSRSLGGSLYSVTTEAFFCVVREAVGAGCPRDPAVASDKVTIAICPALSPQLKGSAKPPCLRAGLALMLLSVALSGCLPLGPAVLIVAGQFFVHDVQINLGMINLHDF